MSSRHGTKAETGWLFQPVSLTDTDPVALQGLKVDPIDAASTIYISNWALSLAWAPQEEAVLAFPGLGLIRPGICR